MTAVQLNAMHTQLLQNIGYIADDEALMRRRTAYSKKLAKEKASDSTLMTKEEYYAMLDEAEQQLKQGEGMTMLPDEDLTAFLKRNGYEI
ncbi:MAG: hypothetical protein IJL48_09930 [Bacteroidales bacterium]|nr:hypothetical protein [Bacteroidales bacterium]